MSENRQNYKFGVVGAGVIGPLHADAIGATEGAELGAVMDMDAARAQKLGEKYNLPFYTDYAQFLQHPGLEVITICVPSGLHAKLGKLAAQAGKHVLVEKPIEVGLEAADSLIKTCREAGVKLGVISQQRFTPGIQQVRQALEAGRFGPLVLGEAVVKWYRTQQYYDSGEWRGTFELDGGGALMNQAIHYVDQLQWMMGQVSSIKAALATKTHNIEVEDVALALLTFANGALGTIQASTSVYPGLPERLEITGRDGTAIVEAGKIKLWEFKDEKGEVGSYGRAPEASAATNEVSDSGAAEPSAVGYTYHAAQYADFVTALRENREPLVNGEEARKPLEIILAIYQAARENREVKLPL